MVPEDTINEFVKRMREAAGENLVSVILFGSAVSGDFHPEFSNLNLFCAVRDSSPKALACLGPAAKWWDGKKQPPALIMTPEELEHSADVFTIELMDMQQHHRVLFGEDVLQGLAIPTDRHRVQVEYELREKAILLRQQYLLVAGNEKQVWELLMRSLPSFITLFRHALVAMGKPVPAKRRDAVRALGASVGFDVSPFHELLDLREKKSKRREFNVNHLFSHYVEAIDLVIEAVDGLATA